MECGSKVRIQVSRVSKVLGHCLAASLPSLAPRWTSLPRLACMLCAAPDPGAEDLTLNRSYNLILSAAASGASSVVESRHNCP